MAKISKNGGPSYNLAQPGEVIADAHDRPSALHPDEQGAWPLLGEGEKDAWLVTDQHGVVVTDDDGEPKRGEHGATEETEKWDGDSSSESTEKGQNFSGRSETDEQKPAPTMANRSGKDATDSDTAHTADGSKTTRKTAK